MDEKKLLIAGIDPGITTAIVLLDIYGNLIYSNSSKQLDLNSLISQSIRFGKVLIVGTDKSKIPGLVEDFAIKVGAKVSCPQEDLKVVEKRRIAEKYHMKDEHQSDALASAIFAFKSHRMLLDKIDQYTDKNKKQSIKNRMKELVILKKLSIRDSVELLEKKDEESTIMKKVIEERALSESDFLNVFRKMKLFEKEASILRRYNNELKKRLSRIEKIQSQERKEDSGQEQTLDFREKRLKSLHEVLRMKDQQITELKSIISKYNYYASDITKYYLLKKLDNLGTNEFSQKNKVLRIRKNDILLVENPNVYSEKVVDQLKKDIYIVVHGEQIVKTTADNLPFVFIDARELELDENKYFGFVDKNQFNQKKEKLNWMKKVIMDYKREKEQLLE